MSDPNFNASLEEHIAHWRAYIGRRPELHVADVAKLEVHLREQVASLADAGLSIDEAFLVAVKRTGDRDTRTRDFAREHSERLWKQLVVLPSDDGAAAKVSVGNGGLVAFCLAVAAGVAIKVPSLFGLKIDHDPEFYVRNVSLFVLPFVAAYFAWKRKIDARSIGGLVIAFICAAVFANVYALDSNLVTLTALHLPIALWLLVGIAYAGGRWGQVDGRMDFIRFTGELLIYYVLIALGGGVFTGFMALLFQTIGINVEKFFQFWVLPCGALGAVVIGSWLVEAKQSVMESMAPVLTRLFTPLFAIMLVAFLVTMMLSGRGIDIGRELLIAFDLLLVVVLGLLLYSASARDPNAPPGFFDAMQVVLVVSALVANAVALWAIGGRISEFGFSPNRVAALGENIILLVNLAWSAVLYIRFMLRRGSFSRLEAWQTNYIPIYAIWAAIVVIVFPLVFRSP